MSAAVVESTDAETLRGFVTDQVAEGATVYTDENRAYRGLPFEHRTVNHSVGEYVDEMIHTNRVESFWSMLKRAHKQDFEAVVKLASVTELPAIGEGQQTPVSPFSPIPVPDGLPFPSILHTGQGVGLAA